jgi:hypothetical protein
MPPGSWVVREKPLRNPLAEIKKTQHCPQQEIPWVVSQIAFERILHRAMTYPMPRSRVAAIYSTISAKLSSSIWVGVEHQVFSGGRQSSVTCSKHAHDRINEGLDPAFAEA